MSDTERHQPQSQPKRSLLPMFTIYFVAGFFITFVTMLPLPLWLRGSILIVCGMCGSLMATKLTVWFYARALIQVARMSGEIPADTPLGREERADIYRYAMQSRRAGIVLGFVPAWVSSVYMGVWLMIPIGVIVIIVGCF